MYLYCQNTGCGVYLGSLGGSYCHICGWSCEESGDQWVIEDADLHPFARAILALRPERVPMNDEQRQSAFLSAPTSSGGHRTAFMLGIQFAEAHHGIAAQAKKE